VSMRADWRVGAPRRRIGRFLSVVLIGAAGFCVRRDDALVVRIAA
jgi:hypothetical protein